MYLVWPGEYRAKHRGKGMHGAAAIRAALLLVVCWGGGMAVEERGREGKQRP